MKTFQSAMILTFLGFAGVSPDEVGISRSSESATPTGAAFQIAIAHAEAICGLVVFDQMSGEYTVYRGVGTGSAWIVERDDSGYVVTALQVSITPDSLWSLNAHQVWACSR